MKPFRLIQIGPSNNAVICNQVITLNSIQDEFEFIFDEDVVSYPDEFDIIKPTPTVFIESLLRNYAMTKYSNEYPIGICDCMLEGGLYTSYDEELAIISTYNWSEKIKPYTIPSALTYTIASIILNLFVATPIHFETRGCPNDFCEELEEIKVGLSKCEFCHECHSLINSAVNNDEITIRQLAAIYRMLDFVARRRLCFVLMPFTEEFNRIYKECIKSTIEKHNWICQKADEIYETKAIIDLILEQIHRADLIVADITGKNANVFYELGYAHAVKKNTILLTQSIADAPFDLRHRQLVKYSPEPENLEKLSKDIEKYL